MAVDDVFQELALAVSKQLDKQRPVARVEPYLYRVAVWQSLLYRRRVGRQRRVEMRVCQHSWKVAICLRATADPTTGLPSGTKKKCNAVVKQPAASQHP
ncbi:MAG: hypothetical protein ACT4QC_09295 [Planctomycetaceae bacterium]